MGAKMVTSGVRALILAVSCALIMHGVNAGAQGKPEKEKIRIGYAARAVTHSIPFLASEAGLSAMRGCRSRLSGPPGRYRRWRSFRAILILPQCRLFS